MGQIAVNVTAAGAEDKTLYDAASATVVTRVMEYEFLASAAFTVTLKDQAGNVFAIYGFTANQLRAQGVPVAGSFRFEAKGDILLGFSGAGTVTGHLTLVSPN